MEGSTAAISSARFISSWATMAVKGKGGTLDQLPWPGGPGRGARAAGPIMHDSTGADSRAGTHIPRQRVRSNPEKSFSEVWT